jgi:hypothetical protein
MVNVSKHGKKTLDFLKYGLGSTNSENPSKHEIHTENC